MVAGPEPDDGETVANELSLTAVHWQALCVETCTGIWAPSAGTVSGVAPTLKEQGAGSWLTSSR